jgi:predicted transcriptional regulator
MRVRDIMRRDFVWFNSGDSFAHVLSRMAQNEISSAPVFHEGHFAGVLSTSDMVRYFGRKDYSSLWKKNKPTPIEKIKGTVALDFARKVRILTPDDKLDDVLPAIAATQVCVPVVENKKLVGLVRSSDVIKFFLTELAKDTHKGVSGVPSAKRDKGAAPLGEVEAKAMNTYIDRLLELVRSEREITINNAALRLGLPRLIVERMCGTLSRHHLVKMVYPMFSETKVRMIDNDQK